MISFKPFQKRAASKIWKNLEYMPIQIDITNACNLRCSHCYHSHHKNTGALKLEDWFEVLGQYKKLIESLNLKPSILICGGEPTISPYLFSVLKRINQLWDNPPVAILTNGTKLNEKLLDLLSQYKIEFQISIDGPNAEEHDAVRGLGNFQKALDGAKLAKKYGIKTNILGILSKKTSFQIEKFFRMAKENSLDSMNFTRFIPQGYGSELVKSGQDDALYGFELRDAMRDIVAQSKKYGIATYTDTPLFSLIDPSLGRHGGFGIQGIVVDYKGNLKVSSRANYKLGNILDEGLENLFLDHPIMKNLRNRNVNGCGGCMYYDRCGGDRNISYALTGSFLEKDKGCWIEPAQLKEGKIA